MNKNAQRRIVVVAGMAAVGLAAVGCAPDEKPDAVASVSSAVVTSETSAEASTSASASASPSAAPAADVKLEGERGVEVTLTGPIAAKYAAATEQQKTDLGKPLTGDRNAGKRESGVVFQQFQGGAIVAENDDPGTPAYIVWGKIREAWNVNRDAAGEPDMSVDGKNGSAGPLGAPTSDELTEDKLKVTTFQHGKITFDPATEEVTVTVNGKEVPSGL